MSEFDESAVDDSAVDEGAGFDGDGVWSDEADFEQYADGEFADLEAEAGEVALRLPTVAIVGRPNVGKSTLVNRILGRREAVVEDLPGVTRDRISYEANWAGRRFMVQDTGGWEPDAKGMAQSVAQQAEVAMRTADAIVLVVDARVGATTTDEAVAKVLRRSKTPVLLAANKVDNSRTEAEAATLWSLGLGEPHTISATHGRGTGDLLDAVLEALPETPREGTGGTGPRRIALIGKPNVGKSSLLNKLAGENRSVVDNVAGTTVDPVDSLVELGGKTWKFIDTAGLRKKVNQASGHEFYASLRTKGAIEAAEVAIVLIDASQPITEQDLRVLSMVEDSGRALVIAYNKWDLVDEDRHYLLEKEIDRELVQLPWALRVNISAQTGRALQKLVPAIETALESWDKRISTGRLNNWLRDVMAATPPPLRGGKLPRVLFATQAATRPPTFVLFTTGFLEAGYRRFLERRLREEFGFEGSPVRVSVRVREKRPRKK
jgi:GTP-binding protein